MDITLLFYTLIIRDDIFYWLYGVTVEGEKGSEGR